MTVRPPEIVDALVALLFMTITVSACVPLTALASALSSLGIGVFFQPITADMGALYAASGAPHYRGTLQLDIRSAAGNRTIPFRELEFYRFRAPLLNFAEQLDDGENPPAGLLLCRVLDLHPPGGAFRLQSITPDSALDGWYWCP